MLATFGHDDLGRRTSLTRGNGTTTTYSYDAVSRLGSMTHDFGGSATTHDLTLGFAYNPASQIVEATRSNNLYAWTGHGSGTTNSTANGLNQLAAHGGATPTHDSKGNLTSDGTFSFTYSSENLMTSGANSGALGYDPLMRFYESYGTYFIHEGGQPVGEYYNGNIAGRYVPGAAGDEPVALIDKFGARTGFHADERGSIIAGSNAAGANSRIVTYDEYGKRGSGGSYRFAYTGQVHLLNDIYDYKARNYNARLGRFLQTDPIGYGDGMNMYAYVGGDPVNFTDPSGLTNQPREPRIACSGTRIQSNCGGGGISNGASPGSRLALGGGTAGLSAQVYTCVSNCGAAEYIPGSDGSLGTWIVDAPVYNWISTGTHWYIKDGRYVFNPYYEKSEYSDAFDIGTGILFAGPIAVIGSVEAAGAIGTAAVAARVAAMNPASKLFARGTGLLQRNNVVRVGQGWKGSAQQGRAVFRTSVGHRSWPTIPGLPAFPWHIP